PVPCSLAEDGGEEPELVDGSGGLAADPGLGDPGLLDDALHECGAERFDVCRDRLEEAGAFLRGRAPVGVEGFPCEFGRGVGRLGADQRVGRLDALARARVVAVEGLAGPFDVPGSYERCP
ncbi:MAG TPA: hypothetical protein VJQ61_09105, partial [Sinomonas sp.]|nr:hypothetical protein [Sinomonas sp.]